MTAAVESQPRRLVEVASPLHAAATDALVVRAAGPGDAGAWERYVVGHPDGTPFHSIGWQRAVESTYRHRPVYLAAWRAERLVGVLPLFEVAVPLRGRSLVSVPYGVGGGSLADDPSTHTALHEAAVNHAAERRCRSIEYRSSSPRHPSLTAIDDYLGFRRDLPRSAEELETWFPRKARACVRNARHKFNLAVDHCDRHLPAVWQLYARNMHRLGSLAYPARFFDALVANFPGRHLVSVVTDGGRPIAGLVTVLHGETVYPYFYGATDDARRQGAAHLIYFALAEWGVRYGYRVFDFGRTRRANVGGVDFKRLCGFEPTALGYQNWSSDGTCSVRVTPAAPRIRWIRQLWPKLPACVVTPLGGAISRYIPG